MKLGVAQIVAASLVIGITGVCTGLSYCQTNASRPSPTTKPSPSQSVKNISSSEQNVNNERSNVNSQAVSPSPETTPVVSDPFPSTQVLSLLVSAILAFSTILFLYLTYRMSKKRSDAENKLNNARSLSA